ncbi:MAG: glycosyltransferase [Ruminococcus sp.]|nr:glycosyltransferase [Ruminococcus sp.]
MGIYNVEATLREALDCILAQTYTNWEVIMCDDGSADKTVEVAMEYVNKYPDKFVLIKNKTNQGLNITLNNCLSKAKGEYIARMDGDDTCSETRFAKQVEILDNNPDIAIVSTDMLFFDESGVWGRTHVKPRPEKQHYLIDNVFCHAAAMVRREAYMAVEGYTVDKRLLRVEDYHLWAKMYAKGYTGVNIQEPLYQMRDDHAAFKRRKFRFRVNEAYATLCACRLMEFPFYCRVYCLKPILKGLVPGFMYKYLHRRRLAKRISDSSEG